MIESYLPSAAFYFFFLHQFSTVSKLFYAQESPCSPWENYEVRSVGLRFSEGYWKMLNNDHYASFVFQIDASRLHTFKRM